jgi:hypothetical protein
MLQTKTSIIFAFVSTTQNSLFQFLLRLLDTSIFLLVPSTMYNPWKLAKKAASSLLTNSPPTEMVEARMYVKPILSTHSMGSAPQSSIPFISHATGDTQAIPARHIVFDYVSSTLHDPQQIQKAAERWLKREDRSPPPWETIDRGVTVTIQAQDLSANIGKSWPDAGQSARIMKLQNPTAGSGATGLARSIGHLQHRSHVCVLWIQSVLGVDECIFEKEWMDEFSRNSSCSRFLVIVDTHVKWTASLQVSLNRAIRAKKNVSALILVFEESTNNYKKTNPTLNSYIINPFLHKDDIVKIFTSLCDFASGAGKEALITVRDAALAKSPRPYARHIFIFTLAAFHGIHIPATEWVHSLYYSIATDEAVKKAAILIAFVCSFPPARCQFLPGDFCDRFFKLPTLHKHQHVHFTSYLSTYRMSLSPVSTPSSLASSLRKRSRCPGQNNFYQ